MKSTWYQILELYIRLGGTVLLGWVIGRLLPKAIPLYLGKFLFWVGVPISIFSFLRRADLSGPVWIAPVVAWLAMLCGGGLAWGWMQVRFGKTDASRSRTAHASRSQPLTSQLGIPTSNPPLGKGTGGVIMSLINLRSAIFSNSNWQKTTRGSFLLSSMVGNTGYLGYPVILALVPPQYFGWALFYDLLGSTLGTYGFGVILASHFGVESQSRWQLLQALVKNPALWSFFLGLEFRTYPLPASVEQGLQLLAWGVVALALLLIGMRLSQLTSWSNLPTATVSLGIKMLLIPLILGAGLSLIGIVGSPRLIIVLQMGMPPAFATLILAEAYNLDREFAVTALVIGTATLVFTLPIWLLLFGT